MTTMTRSCPENRRDRHDGNRNEDASIPKGRQELNPGRCSRQTASSASPLSHANMVANRFSAWISFGKGPVRRACPDLQYHAFLLSGLENLNSTVGSTNKKSNVSAHWTGHASVMRPGYGLARPQKAHSGPTFSKSDNPKTTPEQQREHICTLQPRFRQSHFHYTG
jgi:hypothetical protein